MSYNILYARSLAAVATQNNEVKFTVMPNLPAQNLPVMRREASARDTRVHGIR